MGFFSNLFDLSKVGGHTADSVAKAWKHFVEQDFNNELDEFDIARKVASLRSKKYHADYDFLLNMKKRSIAVRYTPEDFIWLVLSTELDVIRNKFDAKSQIKWDTIISSKLKEAGLWQEKPDNSVDDLAGVPMFPEPFYKS